MTIEEDMKQFLVERALDCNRQMEEDQRHKRYVDRIYNRGKRDAYRLALNFVKDRYARERCSERRA